MPDNVLLWIAVAAYAAHALEEYVYDWKTWAVNVLRLPVDWPTFYMANAAVIVLGASSAAVGWRLPEYSLIFPALMVINAVLFHLVPTITRRHFSPGLGTAIVLFLPLASWIYAGAYDAGVLTIRAAAISTLGGALVMTFPIVLLKTKDRRIFRQ